GESPREIIMARLAAMHPNLLPRAGEKETDEGGLLTFARRLAHVESIPQQDSAQTAFNKLARTFAAQVEALKRYRSGGQQKMTVQHGHVAEGGQAIVGNVNATREGVGARKKVEEQPHALAYAPGVAMSCDIE